MGRISNFEIIKILLENGRMPYSKIAKEFDVTEATIRKRVNKMKKDGVIRKFTIDVEPKKLGFKIQAIIGFDLHEEYYTSTLLLLKKRQEIISLTSSTGDHMVMLEAWFEDLEQLHNFEKELSSLPGVMDICPAIIIEKLK
ncbi:MAG: Lrp/AsnC family transcriptional regulator [Candidatus Heimdallarchaeaceae archaeon]